jgi:hypothetical protein
MTDKGESALDLAETLVPPNKEGCKAQLRGVLVRLADHGEVRNEDLFKHEEDGIFVAKARCGLRAYGWFCTLPTNEKAFVIAHAVMKKKNKAKQADLDRVRDARQRFNKGEAL